MADEGEEEFLRQLQTFGAPDHVRAYVRDQRMLENHGARISVLETNFAGMQAQLAELAKDAGETRAELSTMLRGVADKVDAISREQLMEAGRKQVATERAVERAQWLRWLLPILLAAGLYLATNFVEDVATTTAGEEIPK